MRFGWLAAAAAMVCAGQAGAETITQGFTALTLPVGSPGPASVGQLNIGAGKVIRSATIFYDATTLLTSDFATFPGVADTGSISYSGTVGFGIGGLPVPIRASNAFSGSQGCSAGRCALDFDLAGSLAIPEVDFALFSGTSGISVVPTGTVNYTVTYNGRPAILMQQSLITGVQGRIVYNIDAVPEPASWAMLIVGVGAVGGVARRKRRSIDQITAA